MKWGLSASSSSAARSLSLPKMLSGANAFEISDNERMNIGAHQPVVWDVTMLHALWLPEIIIRQGQVAKAASFV